MEVFAGHRQPVQLGGRGGGNLRLHGYGLWLHLRQGGLSDVVAVAVRGLVLLGTTTPLLLCVLAVWKEGDNVPKTYLHKDPSSENLLSVHVLHLG